jgi:hypothetical protein
MRDTFADGTQSITSVLRPRESGWREISGAKKYTFGYPSRAFFHERSRLFVMSAVEVASDENKGPEYHISISKQLSIGAARCDSNEAKWVLDQFGLDGAEEDNHVPSGVVRNFWRPVATGLIGIECRCKADEPAIVEDRGDFVWRATP